MLSFAVPADYAYFFFAAGVSALSMLIYALFPLTRMVQRKMSVCGLIGGPVINRVYQVDFWHPLEILPWFPLESALFGAGFLGIVTALTLGARGTILTKDDGVLISWEIKLPMLLGVVFGVVLFFIAGWNTVLASAVGMSIGSGIMLAWRSILWPLIWRGALVSFLSHALLVGAFLSMVSNSDALGVLFSPFYAAYGPGATAVLLVFWSAAFGALFGPFYPWWKNLRPDTSE